MKYKQRIITGAIALSLLVGSPIFAATMGGSHVHVSRSSDQPSRRDPMHKKKGHHMVGTVTGITGSVFTIETHMGKHSTSTKALSVDIHTVEGTQFKKNGLAATLSDVHVGNKVIIVGAIDANSQVVHAKQVKIITN